MWWDERPPLSALLAIPVILPAHPPSRSDATRSEASARKAADGAHQPLNGSVGSSHGTHSSSHPGRTPQPNSQPAVTLRATIDLDCPYVRKLVVAAFARRPEWYVTVIDGEGEEVTPAAQRSNFHWGEYERIDWERVHSGAQASSSYCVRKGLIRKAHLAHNLKKWAAKHPGGMLAAAVPETHILEVIDVEYIDEALSDLPEVRDMVDGSARWIIKPSVTNQAAGIAVIDSCAGLRRCLEDSPDLREWVAQRYVERPLLIRGRKFHLRAYVLCIGSLQVYSYSEMLALFAGTEYDTSLTRLGDLSSHLTNTCCQADSGAAEADLVQLLSELPASLVQGGMQPAEAAAQIAQLRRDCECVIGECVEAVSSELTFFTLPNCFELFGFDLLVDEDWHVWLLEANAEPDFMQTGDRLRALVAGVIESSMQLVADPLASSLAEAWAADNAPASAADHTLRPAGAQSRAARSCSPSNAAAGAQLLGVGAHNEERCVVTCDVPGADVQEGDYHGSWHLVYEKQGRAGAIGMHVM